MKTTPSPGDNPEGLSTMDPMRHAGYRETVRAISDRYMSLKGKPILPHTEVAWASPDDERALAHEAGDDIGMMRPLVR